MVVKALILAAGKGTRLGISTKTRNKCMLRVGGFPLITEHLRRASQLQVTEALVVVGHFGESIKSYFGGVFDGLPIRYFYQRELNGPVGAMQCVASELKEDFVLSFADEYFVGARHLEMMQFFKESAAMGVCGVLREPNLASIRKTYSLSFAQDGRILSLIEKPKKPMTPIKGTGFCFFKKDFVRYLCLGPKHKSAAEQDFPSLVQCAIDDGQVFRAFDCCERFYNLNQKDDWLELSMNEGLDLEPIS